ncbi:MAG TPA: glutamate racemase [Bdellovibrionales bacterium]|nr:glutamate racemase [Bdellovibrionales bacterium]
MCSIRQHQPIGLYDSGIGGFSILREVHSLMPSVPLIYVADDANAPYGEKQPAFVQERARIIVDQLMGEKVAMVVVACNTATAVAIDFLRQNFSIPFVGVEPYLNVLNKWPELNDDHHKTAVATTVLMGQSARFLELRRRLDPKNRSLYFTFPNLATLVEQEFYNPSPDFEAKLELELAPLKGSGATHLILGCTHYPLVQNAIEKILKLKAISPCRPVANRCHEIYQSCGKNMKMDGEATKTFRFFSTKQGVWKELSFDLFHQWPK